MRFGPILRPGQSRVGDNRMAKKSQPSGTVGTPGPSEGVTPSGDWQADRPLGVAIPAQTSPADGRSTSPALD